MTNESHEAEYRAVIEQLLSINSALARIVETSTDDERQCALANSVHQQSAALLGEEIDVKGAASLAASANDWGCDDDCDCDDDESGAQRLQSNDVANADAPSSGSLAEYRKRRNGEIEGNDATPRSTERRQRRSLADDLNDEARDVRLVDPDDAGNAQRVRIVNKESREGPRRR